ncbi:Transcriptional regulatory protein [Tolypocladium capitatum]|uniref:Transcriptional regulatory protein n=1 Tax=Tolypocladium capitatum TaxID=45235 RepID=A0A2K3QQQ9_9HYPO|nr:Transcriptional regulatory protein [Tolypocladium capitatum]
MNPAANLVRHADAVPKKRGPKTDVLEALLRRVDGLEAKLKEKNAEGSSPRAGESAEDEAAEEAEADEPETIEPPPKRVAADANKPPFADTAGMHPLRPVVPREVPASPVRTDAFLHTYFTRFHGKPYYILDESSVRQRVQLNQLPGYLCYAIWAVAARRTPHPHGHDAAIKVSEDHAAAARRSIDMDEPSMDGLQALLLLVLAFTAAGKGKKAYMLMTSAIGMAMALELHRERDAQAQVTPVERELRRRLFWTCYLIDRFFTCGTKRSSLIRDKSIALRLPSWCPAPSAPPVDGEFFQRGSNLQYIHDAGKKSQGSTGMLIDITRILGITNRYLAAGGVKGDSHFPWHSLSTLSKIRQELDFWASGTGYVFSDLDGLIRQQEATSLLLGKLIYHLIHCLVYRPFLPIDLAELTVNGRHQSWQIEATNMCFMHANAIAELIDFAGQADSIQWPALVGYCICTAATVHIHGAHYSNPSAGGEMNVSFSSSGEFLSREMQQLGELQHAWSNVQHQRETLQGIYAAHGELVNSLLGNAMPGFHLEDFFDRYSNIGGPGGKSYRFDPAHLSLSDTAGDFVVPSSAGSELTGTRGGGGTDLPNLKRKNTASSSQKRPDVRAPPAMEPQAPGLPSPAQSRAMSHQSGAMQRSPAGPGPMQQYAEKPLPQQYTSSLRNPMDHAPPNSATSAPGPTYGISPSAPRTAGQGMPARTGPYIYGSGLTPSNTGHASMNENDSYDPMFGTLPTNAFTSPAAWQGDDSQRHNLHLLNSVVAAPSPATKSTGGSTGTAQTEEKDPFLSLLERLAENEQHFNKGWGGELDFFLTGNGGNA